MAYQLWETRGENLIYPEKIKKNKIKNKQNLSILNCFIRNIPHIAKCSNRVEKRNLVCTGKFKNPVFIFLIYCFFFFLIKLYLGSCIFSYTQN